MNAQNVIKILTPASAVKFVDLKKFGRVYFLTNFCPKVKSSTENFTNQNYRNITLHWIRTEHRVSGSPCLLHPKRQLYVHKRNGLTIPVSFPGNREICAAICCWNLVLKFLQIGGFHWTENPSMKIETVQRNECI